MTFSPPQYVCDGSTSSDGSYTSHCHYDSSDSCNARVQFYTDQEQRIEIIYRSGQDTLSKCREQIGKMIDVAYHIANPHDARVPPPEISPLVIVVIVIYIIFCIIFLIFWFHWWFRLLRDWWW